MLFVAEYSIRWETLEAAVAKRLEWDEVLPDTFRFVAEYVWQHGDPPFRGIAIIDAEDVEALNNFVLHYGPTLDVQIRPATDVRSAIGMLQATGTGERRKAKPVARNAASRRSRRQI